MRRAVWRIVAMVALGIGGLVVALALTLGALAVAGGDVDEVVDPGNPDVHRPQVSAVTSPSRVENRTEAPSSDPSPSPSADGRGEHDDGSDDDGSGDDSSGPGSGSDDSSGPGSGSDDSSGSGSGSDDHSDDDD